MTESKTKEGDCDMAKVYAIDRESGSREVYGVAGNNRELYKFTDDIEELGMDWDFDLM